MKLTEHFTLEELSCRCGCKTPSHVLANLKKLAAVLEKIRLGFNGRPVHVNCGYRCKKHNKAVGGAESSQHLTGKAADIRIDGETPQDIAIVACQISEVGGIGKYHSQGFAHIDIRDRLAGRMERWDG